MAVVTEEKHHEGDSSLATFRDLLCRPEHFGATIAYDKSQPHHEQLQETCQFLFRRVERLAQMYRHVIKKETKLGTLSGLDELLVRTDADDENSNANAVVNSETLFGQIEIQNQALNALIKKSIKKLTKATESGEPIRLLEDIESDEEEEYDDASKKNENSGEEGGDASDQHDDESIDQDTKRIRARMERAMEDMDDEEEDEEEKLGAEKNQAGVKKSEVTGRDKEQDESVIDPAAEELNDGFFDINEMEAFADEEEEYLPDEAYGEEKLDEEEDKKVDQRSFHQRQRDGDVDKNDDESDDSNDDDDMLQFRTQSLTRRRRYREDDEVEALYSLYKTPDEDDYDEEGDDNVIHFTASDIFGGPSKKYLEKYKSKLHAPEPARKQRKKDDDSWDDYDFEKEEGDDEIGWGRKGDDGDSANDENQSQGDVSMGENKIQNDKDVSGKKENVKSKLLTQTEQLEKEMLAEKPWQMTGETTSTKRPVNSLLESTPEFEVASKQAPVITVEHTEALEDVIKRRILNEDWDDVIPRELPDVGWNQKRGELPEVSQEKSKLGLGELYEREFLKKAIGYDVDAAEKQSEEDKAKNEMKSLFAQLCSNLDALSNYHFAPRPVAEEAEVRTLTKPAIAMEEVLPLHVSDARTVAPEEVFGTKRGREAILRGESELEQADKKRIRSTKKAARRKARKEKQADEKLISRLQPGLGLDNPYEKRKMREELAVARSRGKVTTGTADANNYGASGTFFKRMQEEATQAIRGTKDSADKTEKQGRTTAPSSSLKL